MRNVYDLLIFTRYLIAEKTGRYFPGRDLLTCLSGAQHRLAAVLRVEGAGFFVKSKTYSMTSGDGEYDLPTFFKSPVRVERVDGNYATSPRTIPHRSTVQSRTSEVTWDIVGNSIVFFPTPTSSTPQYKLWYKHALPDLAYGACPTGSTVSAVKLATVADTSTPPEYAVAAPYDDYYNGLTFEIVAGTAVGEVFTVSDYVGSTRVITPEVDLGVSPDATSYYASHIQLDEDLWEPMCLLAANISKLRDNDGKYLYGKEFVESIKLVLKEAQFRINPSGMVTLYDLDGVV